MQIKYLERWLNSPYPGRRRKSLRTLSKYAVHGKYDPERIFPIAVKVLETDNDWKVRSSAVSSITEITLKYSKFLDDTLKIFTERFNNETHVNVKGNILNGLSKIIEKYDIDDIKSIYDLCLNAIKDPNSEVKHGAIRALVNISLKQEENLDSAIKAIIDIIEELPPLVKKETIRLLGRIYERYPEKVRDTMSNLSFKYITSNIYMLREETLKITAKLIENNHIEITDELLMTLRKNLRYPKACVKMATIDVINAVWKKNIETADHFLDIIANEILLKSKNRRLKIKTLELLLNHIDNIPKPIINKHKLPRILDIIEYNTIPKNEMLRKIKMLSRTLLEEKLGYTFEDRKRLREK